MKLNLFFLCGLIFLSNLKAPYLFNEKVDQLKCIAQTDKDEYEEELCDFLFSEILCEDEFKVFFACKDTLKKEDLRIAFLEKILPNCLDLFSLDQDYDLVIYSYKIIKTLKMETELEEEERVLTLFLNVFKDIEKAKDTIIFFQNIDEKCLGNLESKVLRIMGCRKRKIERLMCEFKKNYREVEREEEDIRDVLKNLFEAQKP